MLVYCHCRSTRWREHAH